MKIVTIVGARPQFIKAAPVSSEIRKKAKEILVHTGQHYDDNMSKNFFDELDLPKPDINLNVGSGSHGWQTAQMLQGIEKVLLQVKPDWVLVYGDTNSTLAGALAASKLNIPLAHVEAGLRSYNRNMPEEINRVLTDHAADMLFCPTESAVKNLKDEGVTNGVNFVGDVMYDVMQRYLEEDIENRNKLIELDLENEDYALATVHRPLNVDNTSRLRTIIEILGKISAPVVFPIHPRTKIKLKEMDLSLPENVIAIEPLGYLDMILLEKNADCIFTDSGGVQKEAYLLGVRCITFREETEWVETVKCGWNKLVGVNKELIIDTYAKWHPEGERPNYFGEGNAAIRLSNILFRS